jgi:hypothetical protein
MLHSVSRSWLIGGWCTTVAAVVTSAIALGANTSTSVLLLVLGVAPAVITVLVGRGGGNTPTVAEILHSVETKTRP